MEGQFYPQALLKAQEAVQRDANAYVLRTSWLYVASRNFG